MGRVSDAMRRARQSGIETEFEPIAAEECDASMLAMEPFPAESAASADTAEQPAAPEPQKPEPVSSPDDREIQDLFFKTYPEKIWRGPQ